LLIRVGLFWLLWLELSILSRHFLARLTSCLSNLCRDAKTPTQCERVTYPDVTAPTATPHVYRCRNTSSRSHQCWDMHPVRSTRTITSNCIKVNLFKFL